MESNVFIGLVLIVAGVADVGVALALTRRIPDRNRRTILLAALLSGAAIMMGLGAAFLLGWMGAPAPA